MHDSSYAVMRDMLALYLPHDRPLRVLDVGSMDVNGSFRALMPANCTYVGCDITPGKNVDIVQESAYHIQDTPDDYDVVISGQCLEHVEMPWLLVQEMARVLKPGGVCILVAPWSYEIHRFPIDCWRILPDGMRVLLHMAGLKPLCEPFTHQVDCWGVAQK